MLPNTNYKFEVSYTLNFKSYPIIIEFVTDSPPRRFINQSCKWRVHENKI